MKPNFMVMHAETKAVISKFLILKSISRIQIFKETIGGPTLFKLKKLKTFIEI